jgi:tetraacyldisaccharide-1-P 4'-kinase
MNRAHIFLLTKITGSNVDKAVEKKITAIKPGAKIFYAHYEIRCLKTLQEKKEMGLDHVKGKNALALSAIANPHYFSYLLKQLGISVVSEWALPDHHHYTHKDAKKLTEHLNHVDFIITTEKDSIKMDENAFGKLPILVLEIMLKIHDEQGFKDVLFKLIS